MKFGVGGGIGPVRAGVSTRGVGGGVGPLSLGGSWRGTGGYVGLAIQAAIIGFVAFWPYLLGTWLAVQFGAAEGSAAAEVAGWVLEAFYVAGILALFVMSSRAKRVAEEQAAEALRNKRRGLRRMQLENEQADFRSLIAAMDEHPTGVSSPLVKKNERALICIKEAALVEPRSAYRNGPKVMKPVDHGVIWFTDHAVRFVGDKKQVEWRYDKMIDVTRGPDHLRFTVSNRNLVSGVAAESVSLIGAATKWGIGVFGREDASDARALAVDVLQDIDTELRSVTASDRLGGGEI